MFQRNQALTLLDVTENREMSALGAWYLTVAARYRSISSTLAFRRLRLLGIPSDKRVDSPPQPSTINPQPSTLTPKP